MAAERQQHFGQPRQIPRQRVGLPAEGVEAVLIEIGGGEIGIVARHEAPGTVVEALAGDVDVIGVEHAMHEARGDPVGAGRRHTLGHGRQEFFGPRIVAGRGNSRQIGGERIIEQAAQVAGVTEKAEALEGADTHMAMVQPHQHAGARRRWLVVALELFAGLDQAEAPGGVDAQGFEHGGRQHLAHAALQRQPAIAHA